ncbi:quinone reductase domain protein [Mycobacterium ulcerans str. Harvey]|uniref:Quinone reductase domain protein n=1 Tax=Mycobacterium ulcerans str. Harvey TaxID=1299332 RepID=A0ABP3AEC7_MYCUL|nr:quinone reductase domain protein [Mycobacterium ulcerans str. Harvey]
MRAIRVTRLDGPDAVEVAEVDEPTGDGVVVDVHAAGVAFPDALLTRGLYQYRPQLPFVLGPRSPVWFGAPHRTATCAPATGSSV